MSIILNIIKKVIATEKVIDFNSIWLWVSIIEFFIIAYLIYNLKSKRKINEFTDLESKIIKDSKKTKINMDNLMDSIHNSRGLYKELAKKCHPDNFINDSKQQTAQEIFQEITENERDFEKLTLIKQRATKELNLTF